MFYLTSLRIMEPIQATFDKGSEMNYARSLQLALCQEFVPDWLLDELPAFVTLKSTNNITIEAFWRWLHEDCGINIYVVIKSSQD
ncbi:hypothetical protein M422DRAFT_271524 [Sphaerobolus stellatus SS14]|uniref:Uncharacterized protein n=1 Tax=Sphaerobolus stellatus (strain SS14) TaxID=990650 RepID=A0A0C9UE49_SPHS4|nr:hypothetical protein M422DRAFT_271524 [Sphaerobolus stellatus SS14]